MAAFNEKIKNKTQSFWVVGNNQSTMLAKSCLSNLRQRSSMTTIHVSQADQMQATVLVQHNLPFLKEQKMLPNHQSGAQTPLLLLDF